MPWNPTLEISTNRQTAISLGFWSAILASVFTILFIVLAVVTTLVFPPKAWSGAQTYAENFNVLEMASFIPAFLLAPTVVVLMACIHCVTPETKKVFSLIALAFAGVYVAIIPTNYYLQLFVVRLNLESGTLDGLALCPAELSFCLLCIGDYWLRLPKSGDPICQSSFQWREA